MLRNSRNTKCTVSAIYLWTMLTTSIVDEGRERERDRDETRSYYSAHLGRNVRLHYSGSLKRQTGIRTKIIICRAGWLGAFCYPQMSFSTVFLTIRSLMAFPDMDRSNVQIYLKSSYKFHAVLYSCLILRIL